MELILPVQEGISPSSVDLCVEATPSPQQTMLLQTAVGGSSRMVFILPVNIERLGEKGFVGFCVLFFGNATEDNAMKSTGRISSIHRLDAIFFTTYARLSFHRKAARIGFERLGKRGLLDLFVLFFVNATKDHDMKSIAGMSSLRNMWVCLSIARLRALVFFLALESSVRQSMR